MQHLFRSRSSTSAVAASKSVSASISCSGCLLSVVGGRGCGLPRPMEQQWGVSTVVGSKNDTLEPTKSGGTGCWRGRTLRTQSDIRPGHININRRLGEFYVRFYSAISEAAQSQEHEAGLDKDKTKIKNRQRCNFPDTHTVGHTGHPPQRNPNLESLHVQKEESSISIGGGKEDIHGSVPGQGKAQLEHTSGSPISQAKSNSALISTYDPTIATRSRQNNARHPTLKRGTRQSKANAFTDPIKAEQSAMSITTGFLDQENLGRNLQKVLNQKVRESDRMNIDEPANSARASEIRMLKDTLKFINRNPISDAARAALSTAGQSVNSVPPISSPEQHGQPYLPSFPRYISGEPPIALNNALHSLMTRRPVVRSVIAKVCYNLLTSDSAPDTTTYNILILNLVYLRQNALAELVFEEMIKVGDSPDEYTILALLELMMKSGDYPRWKKIVRLQKKQGTGEEKSGERSTTRQLLETLIIHSARWGRRDLIRRYVRALKGFCAEDPNPGRNVLTALLRFYSERREWENGRSCWWRLLDMDSARIKKAELNGGLPQGEEILDDYAWYWWLKHCKLCGKEVQLKRWLSVAKERGVDGEKLLSQAPMKDRGLPVRDKNKSPLLSVYEAPGDWWQKRWEKKRAGAQATKQDSDLKENGSKPTTESNLSFTKERRDPSVITPLTESEQREILGNKFYDRLFGITSPDNPTGKHWDSTSIFYSDNPVTLKVPIRYTQKPTSSSSSSSSSPSSSLSSTYNDIGGKKSQIWENIIIRRMNILMNRYKAQELKESVGDIVISEQERRRGEILMRWKQWDEDGAFDDVEDNDDNEEEEDSDDNDDADADDDDGEDEDGDMYVPMVRRRVYSRPRGRGR